MYIYSTSLVLCTQSVLCCVLLLLCRDWFYPYSWRCHQMGTFFRVTVPLWGEPPVTGGSPHKGQWRGALMFSLICAWSNGWANNLDAGDLRRHRADHNVTVMSSWVLDTLAPLIIPQWLPHAVPVKLFWKRKCGHFDNIWVTGVPTHILTTSGAVSGEKSCKS